MSGWFLEAHRDEYDDVKRVSLIVDNVVYDTLTTFYQNVFKYNYGYIMTFYYLHTTFDRTPTAIRKQKYKVKRKLKEAGL